MKTFLKITLICLPLITSSQLFSQVRWGVDLHFGTPPPHREIIVERPYPDAIWMPGYYSHYGYRHIWVPEYWRRPEHFYRGWQHRDRYRDEDRREFDRDENREGGRYRFDHHEGRIR